MTKFPASVPELVAEHVRLRELSPSDIPSWYARATDVESADLAGDPVPASMEEGEAWLRRHRERFGAHKAIRWAIVLPRQTKSVGTVGLTITSHELRVCELSIVVARAHWHQGVGSSAAGLAIGYGFGELGMLEVHAEVLQRNLASLQLLAKLGFQIVRAIPAAESSDGEALFHLSLEAPPGRLA